MLASLVFGIALTQVQEPAKDYKFPVMTIRDFGEWLGKETDSLVIVNEAVAETDIYINVKNRTLTELTSLVEKSANVKVLRANGAVTLLPGEARGGGLDRTYWDKNVADKIVEDGSEAKLREQIQSTLADIKKMEDASGMEFGKIYQRIEKAKRYDPGLRILWDFVRSVGFEGFNALPERERIVYSTHPTRMQKAWPSRFEQQLTELNRVADIKNKLVDELKPKGGDDEEEFYYYDSELTTKYGGAAKPIKAMQMVVRRSNYGVSLELRLYDGDGRQRMSCHDMISGVWEMGVDLEERMEQKAPYADLEGELTFSEAEVNELSLLQSIIYGFGEKEDYTKADLEYIASFDTRNPFSGAFTKVLDYACEVTGNEAVLEVREAYLVPEEGKMKASDAAIQIFYSKGGDLRNQLVTSDMTTQSFEFEGKVPRRALASVAKTLLKDGVLTIDTLADSTKLVPTYEGVSVLLRTALRMSAQGTTQNYFDPTDWMQFTVMAYAELNRQQRQAARSEAGLIFETGRMPSNIQSLFQDYLKMADINSIETHSMEMFEEEEDEMGMYVYYGKWADEQTVFLAEQTSWPARLKLQVAPMGGLMTETDYGDFKHKELQDLESAAMQLFWSQRAEVCNSMPMTFAAVAGENLTLELMFGQRSCNGAELTLLNKPVGKFGGLDSLPEDVRKKITEYMEKYRKAMEGGGEDPPAKSRLWVH